MFASRTRRWMAAIAVLVGASLIADVTTAAWGDAGPGDGGSAVVGSFSIGDGLEAMVDERDGAMRVSLPVPGLNLSWDSRAAAGAGRYGFGAGWDPGLGHVDTRGGVRVATTSGRMHEADDTHPSGLAGYGAGDLRFEQRPGVLPARPDGAVGETAYAFVLYELGGTATYFNEAGDPVVRTSGIADRTDWEWADSVGHRLTGVVSPDGVRTSLDWERDPGTVFVQPAANLGDAARTAAGTWRIALDGGRVGAVHDPVGGRISIGTNRDSLIDRLSSESGATTTASWQLTDDGVARVAQLTTADADGARLSTRTWQALDSHTSSGWPLHDASASAAGGAWEYATELSDGHTSVRSTYSSLHTLQRRELVVSAPSGAHEITAMSFAYEGQEGGVPVPPELLPVNWAKPIEATRTFTDPRGATRVETETFDYDERGRTVRHGQADDTVTVSTYASDPEDGSLPPALPVIETSLAADGSVTEARHTLHPSGAEILTSETRTGTGGAPTAVAGRTEWTIEPDGFVSDEHVFHGDAPDPLHTRWERTTDLPAGRQTVTETLAAGTAAQTRTSQTISLVHGEVLEQTDPLGNTTTAEYDALGRVTTMTDASDRALRTGYTTARSDGSNMTITTGPDGVTQTETRDEVGRIIQLHDDIADGTAPRAGHVRVAETRAYPDPATVEVTDAWGATTIARQDPVGRTVEEIAPNGLTKLVLHDDVANTTTTALTPTGRLADAELTSVERRDATGNTIGTDGTRRDGHPVTETRSEFDGFGRLQRSTDGAVESRIERDALGNPTVTTLTPTRTAAADASEVAADAPGGAPETGDAMTSIRRFDPRGNSLEKTLRTGDEERSGGARTLDELGRTITKTDQLDRVTTIGYTPDGLQSRIEHGTGQITAATYHPVTRELVQTRVSAPGRAEVTTEHRSDPVTGRPTALLDPADPDGTLIEYEWNAFGLLVETRYPDGSIVRRDYDEHGRKTGTIDPAGARTEYTYDDTGAMTGAVQRSTDGDELARVGYTHDAFGRIARVERGNGVATTTTYTSASQIATEVTIGPAGPLSERRYEYDVEGNLTSRVDVIHPTDHEPDRAMNTNTDTDTTARTTTTYEYDAYHRLIGSATYDGETTDAGPTEQRAYELTVAGDIARETTTVTSDAGHPQTTVREFTYSALGELETISTTDPAGAITTAHQVYDDAGNLITGHDGATTVFDAANRPRHHTTPDGTTRATTYWADGTRRALTTTTPGGTPTTTGFVWDDGVLLGEHHQGSEVEHVSYLLAADRHARVVHPAADRTPAEIEYHGTDRHGNVTELTDRAGEVTARHTYSDAGVRHTTHPTDPPADGAPSLPANPFGYAGEYTHDDGTQHLNTRIYDPLTMRFTSMDTAELHNAYAYADLNPITKVDPEGTSALSDTNNVLLAVFGLFMAVVGLVVGPKHNIVGAIVAVFDLALAFVDVLQAAQVIDAHPALLRVFSGIGAGVGAISGFVGIGYRLSKSAPLANLSRIEQKVTKGASAANVAYFQERAKTKGAPFVTHFVAQKMGFQLLVPHELEMSLQATRRLSVKVKRYAESDPHSKFGMRMAEIATDLKRQREYIRFLRPKAITERPAQPVTRSAAARQPRSAVQSLVEHENDIVRRLDRPAHPLPPPDSVFDAPREAAMRDVAKELHELVGFLRRQY